MLEGVPVKAEPLVGLGPVIQRFAPEADAGPGSKLLIAVLTQHISGDGLVVDAGLTGQRTEETGGIQTGAGAEHRPRAAPDAAPVPA